MTGSPRPSLPHRCHRPDPPADGRAGFGLIEAIVALAIAGLVLAAITEIAGRTLRSWNRGLSTVAAVERSDIALGRLAADLTGLLPVPLANADTPEVLFAGDEHGMAFTALTPLDRSNDGIAVVEIGIEAGRDGAVVTRRLRRGRDLGLRDGDRVVLLSGRLDIAFAYRDQRGKRVTRWSTPGEVPRGVVVTLVGGREGGGMPVAIVLPVPVAISVSCLLPPADGTPAATPGAAAGRGVTPAPTGGEGEAQAEAPPSANEADRRKRCATGPIAGGEPASGEGGGRPKPIGGGGGG